MARMVYAIYRDSTVKVVKEIKHGMFKPESAYEITKWIAKNDEGLKEQAKALYYKSPVIGFNLSGKVTHAIANKIKPEYEPPY